MFITYFMVPVQLLIDQYCLSKMYLMYWSFATR